MPSLRNSGDVTPSEQIRWRLAKGFKGRWRHWGEEHVVFHLDSADTHLLDSAAAALLQRLQEASQTERSLAEALVAEHLCREEESQELIQFVLDDLSRLGLIEPEP